MQTLLSQWWIWNIAIPVALVATIIVVGLKNGGIRRADPRNKVAKPLPASVRAVPLGPNAARRALQDVSDAQSAVAATIVRQTRWYWVALAVYIGGFTALHAFPNHWSALLNLLLAVILPVAGLLLRQAMTHNGVRPQYLKGRRAAFVFLGCTGGIAALWGLGFVAVAATGSRLWWLPDGILVGVCFLVAGLAFTRNLYTRTPITKAAADARPAP